MNSGSIERVFVVHHTHMDVGYTDLPHEVLDQHLGHLDLVLDLCRKNPDLPPEKRFHWTCESALLVRDYLACRPQRQREALLTALREGWIELMAFLPTLDRVVRCAHPRRMPALRHGSGSSRGIHGLLRNDR